MAPSALIDTYAQYPLDIIAGRGAKLFDRAGREYWDLYGGHAVAAIGHSHPALVDALRKQAAKLTFYSNVLALDIREEAARRLCAFAGADLSRAFFCNSGAEANENALKLAIQQTGRTRLAALVGGWHGRTLLALSVTDDERLRKPMAELLVPTQRLRPNETGDLAQLDETIAAVMVEPILSIAGIVELSGPYLQALRRRCDEVGALLIYDEVQTGMGRLGRSLAAGEHGVKPDLVTLAKALAGGVPMGAVLMNNRVAERVKQGDLGSTFGGGPVACAAMLATLDVMTGERLLEHAHALGERARDTLCVGPVREVLGRGCLLGLMLNMPAKALHSELLNRGFITGTSSNANVLRLMPPLNTPTEAIDALAGALAESTVVTAK